MVDYKSSSADSELNSAYDYLRNNDFKQCKKVIEKKLLKLKSVVDITNFKILKLILLHKTKKFREVEELKNEITDSILNNKALYENQGLLDYLYKILREVRHEKTAVEIFKQITINKTDLNKLSEDQQEKIIKELIYNNDFSEAYKILSKNFIPNAYTPEKIRFYTLLKYELVYNMTFKLGILKEMIAKITFKEMLNTYKTKPEYQKEKGFIDLIAKFFIAFKDNTEFKNFFDEKEYAFTNAPIKDLLRDIYLKENNKKKVLLSLIKNIEENYDKFNFTDFERLINFPFSLIKEEIEKNKYDANSLISKIASQFKQHESNLAHIIKENDSKNKDSEEVKFSKDIEAKNEEEFNTKDGLEWLVSLIFDKLFNIFTVFFNKSPFFNTTKSAFLGLLMIISNLVQINNNKIEDFNVQVLALIKTFLIKIRTKHSVVNEIIPYLNLINESQRKELLDIYSKDSNDVFEVVLSYKLRLILDNEFRSNTKASIKELIDTYFSYVEKETKTLEKGERLDFDDLILIINEIFTEELKSQENNFNMDERKLEILALNYFAHTKSPYNYDITMKHLQLSMDNGLNIKSQEIYKFMNLKGPQYETCSYIVFRNYLDSFFKQGLSNTINNFNKWEGENSFSTKKTLWKMLSGRNFYYSEQLLDFAKETDFSYFKHILQSLELFMSLEEKQLGLLDGSNSQNDDKAYINSVNEEIVNLLELINDAKDKFIELKSNNKIIINQDMFISKNKYDRVEELPIKQEITSSSDTSISQTQQFSIDCLNKNNNFIYKYAPTFKNNYLPTLDKGIFSVYNDNNFLIAKYLEELILYNSIEYYFSSDDDIKLYSQSVQTIINNFIKFNNLSSDDKSKIFNGKFSFKNSNNLLVLEAWMVRLFVENFKIISLCNEMNKKAYRVSLITSKNDKDVSTDKKQIKTPSKEDLVNKEFIHTKFVTHKNDLEVLLKSIKSNVIDHLNEVLNNNKSVPVYSNLEFVNKITILLNTTYKPLLFFLRNSMKELLEVKKDLKEKYNEIKEVVNNNIKAPLFNIFKNISEASIAKQESLEVILGGVKGDNEFTSRLLKENSTKDFILIDIVEERRETLKSLQEQVKFKKALLQESI